MKFETQFLILIPLYMCNSGYPATFKNMMPVQLHYQNKEIQTVPVQLH